MLFSLSIKTITVGSSLAHSQKASVSRDQSGEDVTQNKMAVVMSQRLGSEQSTILHQLISVRHCPSLLHSHTTFFMVVDNTLYEFPLPHCNVFYNAMRMV